MHFRDIATDTVQLSRQSRRDSCHISISCRFYGLPVQPFYVVPPCALVVTFQPRKHFWKWHILSVVNKSTYMWFGIWYNSGACFKNARPSLQLHYIMNICKQYANGKMLWKCIKTDEASTHCCRSIDRLCLPPWNKKPHCSADVLPRLCGVHWNIEMGNFGFFLTVTIQQFGVVLRTAS